MAVYAKPAISLADEFHKWTSHSSFLARDHRKSLCLLGAMISYDIIHGILHVV